MVIRMSPSWFAKAFFCGGIRIAIGVRSVVLEGPAIVIIIEIRLGMIGRFDDGMLIFDCSGGGMMEKK